MIGDLRCSARFRVEEVDLVTTLLLHFGNDDELMRSGAPNRFGLGAFGQIVQRRPGTSVISAAQDSERLDRLVLGPVGRREDIAQIAAVV